MKPRTKSQIKTVNKNELKTFFALLTGTRAFCNHQTFKVIPNSIMF